ncbi:MAG: hypothetical protein WA510_20535, partial [Acidobacteriaceae bacterium]
GRDDNFVGRRKLFFHERELQVPPLRYASVGTTTLWVGESCFSMKENRSDNFVGVGESCFSMKETDRECA